MKSGTGYQLPDGTYSNVSEVTFGGVSGSQAATIATDVIDVGARGCARLTLNVTTATAGSLDVTVQTRKDESDSWRTVAAFAQKTTVTSERKCFSGLDRQVRANCVIVTGPFEFSISGELV